MRAWLIVNPASTSVRTRLRSDVASVLRAGGTAAEARPDRARRGLNLTVVHTTHRGHATTLAREALDAQVDLVVVMGGDGTVNEVLNGLAATGSADPDERPMLGFVGGGKTNVFARALGLPGNALKAASALLALLDAGERRRISLGQAAGRHFAVGAGLGLDGAIVREVERQRRANRAHDDRVYVLAGLRAFAHWDRSHPHLRVSLGAPAGSVSLAAPAGSVSLAAPSGSGRRVPAPAGETQVPGHFAIASNGDPYTYLGPRPFRPTPQARFEAGLDLLVGQTMSPPLLTRAIAGMLSGRTLPSFPGLPVFHDQQAAVMVSEVPLPFQVDGEYLGDVTEVEVRSLPDALTVVAPREAARSSRPLLAPWWSATRPVWRPGPWRREDTGRAATPVRERAEALDRRLAQAMPGWRQWRGAWRPC
jgi:diacylglycerol kinase family enzyme